MRLFVLRVVGLLATLFMGCSDLGDAFEPEPDCDRSTGDIYYGRVELGYFANRTITIGNSGTADLTGTIALSGEHFTVQSGGGPFSVAPEASWQVTLRFAPKDTGFHFAELDLGGECPPVTLAGVGGYPSAGPQCVLDPATLAFGNVTIGEFEEEAFEIRNVGLIDFLVDVASPCAPEFAVVSGGDPTILDPGDTLRVTVRFTPAAPGNPQCTIAIGPDCDPVIASGVGDPPISYAADIQPIFNDRCVVCHQRTTEMGGLNLLPSASYGELVNVVSTTYAPAVRIKPFNPGESVLYNKITNTGRFGDSMPPPGGGPPVPEAERELIRTWILGGAVNN